MLKKRKNNKGFTLVELLVVIAIIGILAVVAVPALFKNIEKGKVADLEADISAIRSAVLSHYADTSQYPTDFNDLNDELEGLSKPFGGSYELTDNTGTNVANSPATLYLKITTKDSSTTISDSGLDKLAQDLGLTNPTTASPTASPTAIGVTPAGDTSQIIIIPLINK